MESATATAFNAKIVDEFREKGGSVGGHLADMPLILVHHVGARSGLERVVPLRYFARPNGRLMIIASNGGSRTHPNWYFNLKSHPRITVEVGTETFRVVSQELDAATRSSVWPTIVAESPAAGEFQRMTSRSIPVFMLTRED